VALQGRNSFARGEDDGLTGFHDVTFEI
jgi:hypothetical protein